jgi:hypothetical protein
MRLFKRIGLALFLALSVCSAFFAQDAAVLMEKAIYTEETLGNLNEAIGLYQQIAADTEAGRATAALALYRLGMCYQKSGRAGDAQTAFLKLARLYPEQQELISKIPARSNAPQFRTAPWIDGELLRYSASTKGSGAGLGLTLTLVIEAVKEGGKSAWRFRTVTGLTGPMESYVISMDSAFTPIDSRQNDSEQTPASHTQYFPNRVVFYKTVAGNLRTKEYALPRTAYSQDQIIYLLRCLPLKEGYETVLPVFKPSDGSIVDIKVTVEGREKITVAAGTFDCYKIVNRGDNAEYTYWLSSDGHFYPVKYSTSNSVDFELSSISKLEKNRTVVFVDSEQGVSLSAPPGWIVYSSNLMGSHLISLLDPEDETLCYMGVTKSTGDQDLSNNFPKVADQIIRIYQTQFKGYQVRDGSRENIAIAGLPAIRFIADHKALISGRDMVMYTIVTATSNKIAEIYFKTTRENFNKWRPVFDSIANSLQMK